MERAAEAATTVIAFRRRRHPELGRVVEARRRLAAAHTGRAWINGREVGGDEGRFRHLTRSHD